MHMSMRLDWMERNTDIHATPRSHTHPSMIHAPVVHPSVGCLGDIKPRIMEPIQGTVRRLLGYVSKKRMR